MADTSQRVMNMVRRRIMENPEISNEELFAAAVQLEPEMRALNMRQFNARYPLQVRRWEMRQRPQRKSTISLFEESQAPRTPKPADAAQDAPETQDEHSEDGGAPAAAKRAEPRPRRKSRARAVSRKATAGVDEAARREIRHRLMRFAETIAGAATIPDAIHSLSSIDEVVDEIVAVLERG